MNKIQAKQVMSFGAEILGIYIDDCPLDEFLSRQADKPEYYKDLCCAWLPLYAIGESKFIWELLAEKRDCNLPILLCPDDLDFWCAVAVAQVRHYGDIVVWEKVGLVTGKINVESWATSGQESRGNWDEEELRRSWNYFYPYFNDDRNIQWIDCEKLAFSVQEYESCISVFKENLHAVTKNEVVERNEETGKRRGLFDRIFRK